MTYAVAQPPFTLKFREMSKDELEAYFAWFHEVTPQRVEELSKAVTGSHGFEDWAPDSSPNSLGALGRWFATQVELRARSAVEIGGLLRKAGPPFEVPPEDLTNRTFSLAMDIGMYFGQVILANVPGTEWAQPLKDKKHADYGQPVIRGFGRAEST